MRSSHGVSRSAELRTCLDQGRPFTLSIPTSIAPSLMFLGPTAWTLEPAIESDAVALPLFTQGAPTEPPVKRPEADLQFFQDFMSTVGLGGLDPAAAREVENVFLLVAMFRRRNGVDDVYKVEMHPVQVSPAHIDNVVALIARLLEL